MLGCRMPLQATGLAGTLVDWREVTFNVSTTPLTPPGRKNGGSSSGEGSMAAQYGAEVDAGIDTGYVLVTSILSPKPEVVSLVGVAGSNESQVVASATPEGLARVEFRGLFLTFTSTYFGSFNGAPLKGVMDYQLQGSLVLEAAVGCQAECGPHGRCTAGNGTAAPACACECGWAGASARGGGRAGRGGQRRGLDGLAVWAGCRWGSVCVWGRGGFGGMSWLPCSALHAWVVCPCKSDKKGWRLTPSRRVCPRPHFLHGSRGEAWTVQAAHIAGWALPSGCPAGMLAFK
jgi:hypothetical protein